MNAELLLREFHRIGEAPDAVPRLRRFILELAVCGKLVEQNGDDETADALLARIETNKLLLLKNKGVSAFPKLPPVLEDEAPFPLPTTWRWVRLGHVFNYDAGTKTEPAQIPEGSWLLELEDIEKDSGKILNKVLVEDRSPKSTKSQFRAGDVLYGKLRPYLNKAVVADAPGFSTTEIVAIRCYADSAPLYTGLSLRRPDFAAYVNLLGQGTKMPRLRTEDALRALFPLPPVLEQHRIAAKVQELMALCDELEAAQTRREACRDKLVTASLHRLTSAASNAVSGEDSFKKSARFYFNHLPSLTTRCEHIQQLRQAILELAVRGRLTTYNQTFGQDQPERGPFPLPATWSWRRIEEIALQVTDGEHATPPRIIEKQIPLVTAKNVRSESMDYSNTDWVSRQTAEKAWQRCKPQPGDILLVCVGATTGRLCILREHKEMVLVRSVALIRPNNDISADFLAIALQSPFCQSQIWSSVKVAAQPCLYINRIKSLIIPLPPRELQLEPIS